MDVRLPTRKDKIVAVGVGVAFMVLALIPQSKHLYFPVI